MAMALVEPPVKKRRGLEEAIPSAGAETSVTASSSRYEDMEMSPEASQQIQQENAAGIGEMLTAVEVQASEDEVKRRNRSEISSLYRTYRTLKGCLARHPSMGPELDRELEKAYSTLLKLASGCSSVRRIAAELIPRYAVFCPTALDPASRVILQICEWTSSVLMQGETGDSIIADTAQACFAGLIELSVAANAAAHSFPGLRGLCAGVCHTMVSYLLCQLNGAPLVYQEQVPLKEDGEALNYHRFFGTLVSSTLSKLICCDPETVLVSCFKLLTDSEQRKHASHFLRQLLVTRKAEELFIKDQLMSDGTGNQTEKVTSKFAGDSLLEKALYEKPNVERRIVGMVRAFRISENAAIVEEALPDLLALVKALRTFSPSDLELTVAPSLEEEPMKSPARSRSRSKSEDSVAARTGRPGDHMFGKVEIDCKDISQKPDRNSEVDPRQRDRRERSHKNADELGGTGWHQQEGDTRSKTSSALSSPLAQKVSPTSTPIAWYRDGDPAAMDVFAASEHLWVGFFGSGVTEHMLRSEFGTFGQLESTTLLRDQGFAIVEFKHIRDAVEARDTMQGALIWGKQLRVKFLDPFHGSRGVVSGVAAGGSRHVWVGRISSQISKDELLKDLASAGFKHPVSVACLIPSGALLLEFDVPEEAAVVMLHIRRRRRDASSRATSIQGGNSHLWVGKIDASVSEDELLSAFSQFGEVTGWKFLRSSACCFIDFRLPEQAAAAKSRLDGTRFVNQPIVVEFKTIQHRSSPRGSSLHSPPARAVVSSLASTLENLCAKFAWGLSSGAAKQRPSRFTQGDPEKLPTKTLWLGLPESASPGFMNESELRTIFNLAADGRGTVTRVLSARTRRGPCRFVEFDVVDAAVAALQNIARHLEPGIQIEFSCPPQQPRLSDHPRRQGFEDYCSSTADRHLMVYDGHKDDIYDYPYSRRLCSPRHYGESISPGMVDPPAYRSQPPPVHPPGYERTPSTSLWQGSPARAPGLPSNTPPPPLPCESPPPPLLSSPPPPPPGSPLQPPPRSLDLAAPVSGCVVEHSWRGPLCKSGLQYCEVMVRREASPFAGYAGDLCEPARWPDKLDVTKRADLKSVKQTISSFPLNQREICRLCACPSGAGEHRSGFVHFMDYLKQRDRAGVVKIPAAHGLWPRLLYIMPWTAEASAMFSVPTEPAESLICVVLPSVLPQ